MHEMPAADIENFAAGQFMKTFGCLQKQNPSFGNDKSSLGVYSAKVIFGLAGFCYLQGTSAGSGEIQGMHGEEEGDALARTLNGSLMGNQSRQRDSGAGGGRLPCQNNTGRSPVAALDSQDRQVPEFAAGQTRRSLLAAAAAGPDDKLAPGPHHPHIGHQVDYLLLGCNQVAAQEGQVVVGEAIPRCLPPFPVLALSALLHCLPCTVQMPSG